MQTSSFFYHYLRCVPILVTAVFFNSYLEWHIFSIIFSIKKNNPPNSLYIQHPSMQPLCMCCPVPTPTVASLFIACRLGTFLRSLLGTRVDWTSGSLEDGGPPCSSDRCWKFLIIFVLKKIADWVSSCICIDICIWWPCLLNVYIYIYTCAGNKKMITNHWLAKTNLRSFKDQSRRSVSAVFQNYIAYRRFW